MSRVTKYYELPRNVTNYRPMLTSRIFNSFYLRRIFHKQKLQNSPKSQHLLSISFDAVINTGTGIDAGNSSEEESSSITNTPFSQTTPPRTTMEDAWKHINHASLSSFARVPFGNGLPNNSMVISSSTTADPSSLNSPPPMMQNQHNFRLFYINTPIIINPNQGLANASSSFGTENKKRLPESDLISEDPRHKRMIKNRESAARSRARKKESISL